MTERYDAAWVRQFYDDYGEKEWGRLVKDPVNEVRLHVHRRYLWRQLLEMEIEACREPGCLDMGTHIIAVVRKPKRREGAGQ